jgi:hypothetical protein
MQDTGCGIHDAGYMIQGRQVIGDQLSVIGKLKILDAGFKIENSMLHALCSNLV